MASVDIFVLRAYRCPHCSATVIPEIVQFPDGPRKRANHQCPDGHIEALFDEEDSIGLTRTQLHVSVDRQWLP